MKVPSVRCDIARGADFDYVIARETDTSDCEIARGAYFVGILNEGVILYIYLFSLFFLHSFKLLKDVLKRFLLN